MLYQQLVNITIEAQSQQYPNRSFHLTQLLGCCSEGGAYLANSQNWGNNPQQVVIKIQSNMRPNEMEFMICLIQYQNQYENGNNQQYLPTYIIRMYDYFEWQNNHCIIMEIGSEELYTYIVNKSQNISMQEKEKICFQITLPILFLHQQKLIHRDIKPENYIKVGNIFKLFDFGLIRSSLSDYKTQQVGSVIFQAPEIIENSSSYTEKVDVWSLACVFYELLSAQSLFDGQSQNEVFQRIKNHKKDQNYVNNKINSLQTSQKIKDILIKMLTYQEQNRPEISWVYGQFEQYFNSIQDLKDLNETIIKQAQINSSNISPNNQLPNQVTPSQNDFIKNLTKFYETDSDLDSKQEIEELQSNKMKNENIQDFEQNQEKNFIFQEDQKAITECNNVLEKLLREGQKQIVDILTNSAQNKLQYQNAQLQQYSLKECKSQSELEKFKQTSQAEQEKKKKEIDELNKQIQEFEEKDQKQIQEIHKLKMVIMYQNERLQKLEEEFELERSKFNQKLKEDDAQWQEAQKPLNQVRAIIDFFKIKQNLDEFIEKNNQEYHELLDSMNAS